MAEPQCYRLPGQQRCHTVSGYTQPAVYKASGTRYLPFIKYPMLIYKADTAAQLTRAYNRGKERELHIGIYTRPLFATKDEAGNHAEMQKFTDDVQDICRHCTVWRKQEGRQGAERIEIS